ncbi:hypothetical protein [Streptomyces adelaidensis]|uniref:hypothetical protein n=1 Tax=Streptomyces adelaidensis TaxID=2796465 RepID=UPI0019058F73|nr:hypothetical protein [Streptomyces adelaidensis]
MSRTRVRAEVLFCAGCYAQALEPYGTCTGCGVERLTPGLAPDGGKLRTDCAGGLIQHEDGEVLVRLGDPPSPVPAQFDALLLHYLGQRPDTKNANSSSKTQPQ